MELISLFITQLFLSNIIFNNLYGISLFSKNEKQNKPLVVSLLISLITVSSSIISYIIYNNILLENNLMYLRTFTFITVIILMYLLFTFIYNRIIKYNNKEVNSYTLFSVLNYLVIGIVMLSITGNYNLVEVLIFSLSSCIGFILISYIYLSIKEKLDRSNISESFKGIPIAIILVAIIYLIFSRFTFM